MFKSDILTVNPVLSLIYLLTKNSSRGNVSYYSCETVWCITRSQLALSDVLTVERWLIITIGRWINMWSTNPRKMKSRLMKIIFSVNWHKHSSYVIWKPITRFPMINLTSTFPWAIYFTISDNGAIAGVLHLAVYGHVLSTQIDLINENPLRVGSLQFRYWFVLIFGLSVLDKFSVGSSF